jgi:OOP family OmpA-OmpF porin
MKKLFLAGVIASAFIAVPAAAQGYIGFGLGSAKLSGADGSVSTPYGLATVSGADSTKGSYKIYGGYQITPNWGVEGQYSDLGKRDFTATLGLDSVRANVKLYQYSVAATGTLPLDGGFAIFGKLGVSNNNGKISDGGGKSGNKTSGLIGIGASYSLTPQLALRLEYEDFGKFGEGQSGSSIHADNFSLSLKYAF